MTTTSYSRTFAPWTYLQRLSSALEALLTQIESLQGQSSCIDEDILKGEEYRIARKLIDTPETRDEITFSWCIEDVQHVRPDLTDQQARKVLDRCERRHDASIGMNWDVISVHAADMFPCRAEAET